TCDGFFFRDKEVVVIGGGNTAVEEAIYLTNHASRVTLVHRRNALRAEKILQDRLFRNPKIDVVWDSVPEEILGLPEPPQVTGVRLRNLRTGAVSERSADGVFIAFGGAREGKHDGNGLGQAPGVSRCSRSGELHPCRRGAQSEPVRCQSADQRARREPFRAAVPPSCPRPDPDRAGRAVVQNGARG